MPVSVLLVEGELDRALLGAVLAGRPVVERGGSKGALKPKAQDLRAKRTQAAYLRDRDFDFLPPEAANEPEIDALAPDGTVLGWRWRRHEIESYLLEPSLVAAATAWSEPAWRDALLAAARRIAPYQAARQTIGLARKALPPYHDLQTRPDELKNELQLPDPLDEARCAAWAVAQIDRYFDRLAEHLGPAAARDALDQAHARWQGQPETTEQALRWCSGKDLLAALTPWLAERDLTPGGLRARLRDHVVRDPEAALVHLAEWQGLVATLRG